MDWTTVGTSVASSLVGGGLIGGLVSLRVARKESTDRQDALALEREKWEHQRTAHMRERSLTVVSQVQEKSNALEKAFLPFAQRLREEPTAMAENDDEVIERLETLLEIRKGWQDLGNQLYLLDHLEAEQAFTNLRNVHDAQVEEYSAWSKAGGLGEPPPVEDLVRANGLLQVELHKVLRTL